MTAEAVRQTLQRLRASMPITPTGDRDLVLGAAYGYDIAAVRPCVESLRSLGSWNCEIALFIDPTARKLQSYLQRSDIAVRPLEFPGYMERNISLVRLLSYCDFLLDRWDSGARYRYVLLTDVRDVIFQDEPFRDGCDDLEFHLEHSPPVIGTCPYNSAWIKAAFGTAVLAEMHDHPISCSGTVSGRWHGIVSYLASVVDLALNLPADVQKTTGIDQGIHNFLLHRKVPSARVMSNFARVATIGYVPPEELRLNAHGQVIGPDGAACPIVHQWDRHPGLDDHIRQQAVQRQRQRDTWLGRLKTFARSPRADR